MTVLTRRGLIGAAAAISATPAWLSRRALAASPWRERRELYPQGVASGEPTADSVILWTRRPGDGPVRLKLEVADEPTFAKLRLAKDVTVGPEADWTCRVLVGGLSPSSEYWYRFVEADGSGSRVGRTLTAPAEDDPSPRRFAFVSCQNVTQGAQTAYRRMIFDDEARAPHERLGFVLHLGDFIYEITWYPEDRPQGMYDRQIKDVYRYPHGEKIDDLHIPTTLEDYRTAYKAYLTDPDLQDARARWPFVAMWDNHEFSWLGWQSFQKFDGVNRPAQTRKVMANQAWWEYLPGRCGKPSPGLDTFDAPHVVDAPMPTFDETGLATEPNNLIALDSLIGHRSIRWGKNIDLIITDQRTYRTQDPTDRKEFKAFSSPDFPDFVPQEAMEIVDGGRDYADGHPPDVIAYGEARIANYAKADAPQSMMGIKQREWFLNKLKTSRATWKIWGDTVATLDMRADPQNLPAGLTKPWPGAGYAGYGGGDHSTCYIERAAIYDFVAREKISGFATIAGDRHSFWAGLSAKALPPQKFEPVGVAFVVGSISAPGMVEAIEHKFPQSPIRPLFLADRGEGQRPEPTVNLTLKHGVKTALDYAQNRDLAKAHALSNPDNAPHVEFVDMGGHGFGVVRADAKSLSVELVCIPRPVERIDRPDGGPIRYRVTYGADLWTPGERPVLKRLHSEGDLGLSI